MQSSAYVPLCVQGMRSTRGSCNVVVDVVCVGGGDSTCMLAHRMVLLVWCIVLHASNVDSQYTH